MAKRPCLGCDTPTTGPRCPRCQHADDNQRWATGKGDRYNTAWRKHSQQTRTAWVEAHGWNCPGYQRPPHPHRDLVVDHDLGVLCRPCNAVKASTTDKQRRHTG